jgi:hypothetical protein
MNKPLKVVKPALEDPEHSVDLFDASRKNHWGEMFCISAAILFEQVDESWERYITIGGLRDEHDYKIHIGDTVVYDVPTVGVLDRTGEVFWGGEFNDLLMFGSYGAYVATNLRVVPKDGTVYCASGCANAWHAGPSSVGDEDGGCAADDELDKLGIDETTDNPNDPLCPFFRVMDGDVDV